MNKEDNIIYGNSELARRLGVSRQAVIKWAKTGKITPEPVGVSPTGQPLFVAYNVDKVREELGKNIKTMKVKRRTLM